MIAYESQFEWKTFLIDLPSLRADLIALNSKVCGISADVTLRVCSTEQLNTTEIADIQAHLDLLEESTELEKREKPAERLNAIEILKAGLLNKSWDAMSLTERKIVVGETPTDEELGI